VGILTGGGKISPEDTFQTFGNPLFFFLDIIKKGEG
jgi:hypothetical protein